MKILVTGGAGFIGSSFLNQHVPRFPQYQFINLDALTYAANLGNLSSIQELSNYRFEKADISKYHEVEEIFDRHSPTLIVHFAAESHVDRSIKDPRAFIRANVEGTLNLLEACRRQPKSGETLFLHVSTDEVFGSLGDSGFFTESSPYDPSSPYSASKAASDHLVRAYARTYDLRTRITNCSNNYGPRQFPEKLIPLMILNALDKKPLPVYGQGLNVRDWLFVEDHCDAIWTVIEHGEDGATYNVGGHNEVTNIDVVNLVCQHVAEETGQSLNELLGLVTYVPDRPGHDHRYAMDASKIQRTLGWRPRETFASGLRRTVSWYIKNPQWIDEVKSGEYRRWIEENYAQRSE